MCPLRLAFLINLKGACGRCLACDSRPARKQSPPAPPQPPVAQLKRKGNLDQSGRFRSDTCKEEQTRDSLNRPSVSGPQAG
eukprot:4205217-Pleurochrysis_carterae.AAC.1